MLKAVVVDDEKLVRKGFISLFDWALYGMVVVGEASDGKSALELLQQTDVDLLFTDITMPGMSGFDLIKETRRRHPRVRSVVLTCHHEFDFVQEALRLGAIDYIVKTLLEPENADSTMRGIIERIDWEEGCRAARNADEDQKRLTADSALVFRPIVPEVTSAALFELPFVRRNPVIECDGMWLVPLVHSVSMEDMKREIKTRLLSRWESAFVTGMIGLTAEEAVRVLAERMPGEWFYSSAGDLPLQLQFSDTTGRAHAMDKQSKELLDSALDLKWTLDAASWEAFEHRINSIRPESDELTQFGVSLCMDWSGTLLKEETAERLLAAIERNRIWADWQTWLLNYSNLIKLRMAEVPITAEVMLCLIRAIQYMKKHAGQKINQAEVAARVNMSRGYFSQCFARLAGESFGSVLRDMRISLAKRLLRETSDPIHLVAQASGFEDDKYFSRLFRDCVGMLPTEYRSECSAHASTVGGLR